MWNPWFIVTQMRICTCTSRYARVGPMEYSKYFWLLLPCFVASSIPCTAIILLAADGGPQTSIKTKSTSQKSGNCLSMLYMFISSCSGLWVEHDVIAHTSLHGWCTRAKMASERLSAFFKGLVRVKLLQNVFREDQFSFSQKRINCPMHLPNRASANFASHHCHVLLPVLSRSLEWEIILPTLYWLIWGCIVNVLNSISLDHNNNTSQ